MFLLDYTLILWILNQNTISQAQPIDLSTQPFINEIYISPAGEHDESGKSTENFIEIGYPTAIFTDAPSLAYGLMFLEDHPLTLVAYYGFNDLSKSGLETEDKNLIVISESELVSNTKLLVNDLKTESDEATLVILVKQPLPADQSALGLKLENNQIILQNPIVIDSTKTAHLCGLAVDALVLQKSEGEEPAFVLLYTTLPLWEGTAINLPVGNDKIIDRLSINRCIESKFSSLSFYYGHISPGISNRCTTSLKFLETSKVIKEETLSQHSDTAADAACPLQGTQVSNYIDEIRESGIQLSDSLTYELTAGSNSKYFTLVRGENPASLKFRCEPCYQMFLDSNPIFPIKKTKPEDIITEQGTSFLQSAYETLRKINTHVKKDSHRAAVASLSSPEEYCTERGPTSGTSVSVSFLEKTARVIGLVYFENKVGFSLSVHEPLTKALTVLGLPLGTKMNTRQGAKKIVTFLNSYYYDELINNLLISQSPISLLLDSR